MISVEVWDRTREIYRKITMRREFRVTRLLTKRVCPCEYPFTPEAVPLGKEYTADLGTIRRANMHCGGCGKHSSIWVVNVLDPDKGTFGPFALAALELINEVRLPNVTIN